jgi:hypothetical protein
MMMRSAPDVVRVEEAALTPDEVTEYRGWKRLGMALGHFADIVARNERDGYFTVACSPPVRRCAAWSPASQHSGRPANRSGSACCGSTPTPTSTPRDAAWESQPRAHVPGGGSKVTGTMAQPGQIMIGPGGEGFFGGSGPWNFEIDIPDGDYALFAATADQMEVRRHVVVHGDTAVAPQIDLAVEGTTLASAAFTATNATASEALIASVLAGPVEPATLSLELYHGAVTAARIAPPSVLSVEDMQTVSVQAADHDSHRALRRPFQIGGDTAYTLPDPLGAVQWTVDSGQLSVAWGATPPGAYLFATTIGFGDRVAAYTLGASESFLAATKLTGMTFATDLPGYHDAWKIDFDGRYRREIDFQSFADNVTRTAWNEALVHDTAARAVVDPSAQSYGLAARQLRSR